jgi:hypothetical protein
MDTSYANPLEADNYLVNTHGAEDWFLLNEAKKEALLITATKQIDQLRFKYFSSTTMQALKCPLRTMDSELGDGLDQAKQATIIQAYFLLQYDEQIQEAKAEIRYDNHRLWYPVLLLAIKNVLPLFSH